MSKLVGSIVVVALCAMPAAAQQVLVVPFEGEAPAGFEDAPARLTSVALMTAADDAVLSAARRGELVALAGCDADTEDCLVAVAAMAGADLTVFGLVGLPQAGDTLRVTVTIVREGKLRSRDIGVRGATYEELATDFEGQLRAFFAGQPPPARVAEPEVVTPPPDEPPPPPASDGFSFARVKGYTWGVAGGGVVLLGTGAVMLGMASSKQAEVDEAPVNTVADLEHLAELERSGERLTLWGNSLLIAGGVATVAGAVLIYYQGRSGGARVTPVATEGGAGVAVTWELP